MGSERVATAALAVALVAAGAAAWWLALRPARVADGSSLAAIPYELGRWRGVDVPVEDAVESMLRADFNVQREYRHPEGGPVWLYLGYYGTDRGGTPEHTPRACYTAHGWSVVEARELVRDPGTGRRANEYVVAFGAHRRLVHFWYRSYRSAALLSPFALRVDHALGRLREGRGDGALVRLSTPITDGDRSHARSRLLDLAARLEPELAARWPEEPVRR